MYLPAVVSWATGQLTPNQPIPGLAHSMVGQLTPI